MVSINPFLDASIPLHILCANTVFFSHAALAAASSPLGVIGGALAGHGAATLVTSKLTKEF